MNIEQTDSIRTLDDSQLEAFDTDFARGERWDAIVAAFGHNYQSDEPIHVLDIGGGNGHFADKLITHFPNAHVTVLDNAEGLLNKNIPHERKQTVLGSADEIEQLFPNQKFDLITYNWVLHHLVGDSYRTTTGIVEETLNKSRRLLTERGKLSVFENNFDGMVIQNLPSRLIYTATSFSQTSLAKLLKKLGANTAGVGVCFRSGTGWRQMFDKTGFNISESRLCDTLSYPRLIRFALLLRPVQVEHYLLVRNPSQ